MDDVMIDGIRQVILGLKPSERRRLVDKLIEDRVFDEEEEDCLTRQMRKVEPSRPYSEIRDELVKKRRLL